MMQVAVDAMGGDKAPREIVAGVVEAVSNLPELERVLLVGRESDLQAELARFPRCPPRIEIVHAGDVIEMGESPAVAIRRKKDSSISRAIDLVKEGRAGAIFSAGNTGAVMAAATLKLRPLAGVIRPAIATVMPSAAEKPFVLIDAGANTDCDATMLHQFAVMGHVYAREVLGVAEPCVGLLSIGGEEAKGNEATKEAFRLIQQHGKLGFAGNVEGLDLFEGRVDVAVCDGFVGNIFLKTSESAARTIAHWIRHEFQHSRSPFTKLGGVLSGGVFRRIRRRSDPSAYGGAPLLGVNGVCIIGHGASNAGAVLNALRVACEAIRHDINHVISAMLPPVAAGAPA